MCQGVGPRAPAAAKEVAVEVSIPGETCAATMELLRASTREQLRTVDKGDEPPIRVLECGVYGESVPVEGAAAEMPMPCLIQRDSRWFCSWRWDSDVLNERLFRQVGADPKLQQWFGIGGKEADMIFRRVLGYGTGKRADAVGGAAERVAAQLEECLKPAALKVFGEEANAEALEASHVYSMYANVLLPGQIINLHVDVPEFRGLDRSKCPTWLLAVAHCSGLFEQERVRNTTCVFYPATAAAGALAVFRPVRPGQSYPPGVAAGKVFPAARGAAVAMDADSCNHHSEQAKRVGSCSSSDAMPLPEMPARACLEPRGGDGERPATWVVVDADSGEDVAEYPEHDLRFSISCKLHVFSSLAEREEYYANAARPSSSTLTAADILRKLCEDLRSRGVELPAAEGADREVPLFKLAPLLVDKYIFSTAPSAKDIEKVWEEHYKSVASAAA
mmetsp:Transcript_25885/g.88570  ORF Transcript_25885/g.88570 Transcript_25885/m.88570 type:complete len:447 (+) Transcript_25885:198-1538(+)